MQNLKILINQAKSNCLCLGYEVKKTGERNISWGDDSIHSIACWKMCAGEGFPAQKRFCLRTVVHTDGYHTDGYRIFSSIQMDTGYLVPVRSATLRVGNQEKNLVHEVIKRVQCVWWVCCLLIKICGFYLCLQSVKPLSF